MVNIPQRFSTVILAHLMMMYELHESDGLNDGCGDDD